jgi:hypothetical protein
MTVSKQTTIKGWPVIAHMNSPMLKLFTVPGTKRKMRLRRDVGPYLIAFAAEYHKEIAPIDQGTFDDWAWAPVRSGRASSKISDHCAGVAIDLNATKEGSQSKSNTWWVRHPIKAARMRQLLRKYRLLEWGGDYKNFYDPMHLVIKTPDEAAVIREIRRLGITPTGRFKNVIP